VPRPIGDRDHKNPDTIGIVPPKSATVVEPCLTFTVTPRPVSQFFTQRYMSFIPTSVAKTEPNAWPTGALQNGSRRHRLWHSNSAVPLIVLDACLAFVSTLAAFAFSPSAASYRSVAAHAHPVPTALLFAAVSVVVSYALGLGYHPNLRSRFRIAALCLSLGVVAMGATLVISSAILYQQVGRYIVIIDTALFILLVTSVRLAWFQRASRSIHRVVLWGDSAGSLAARELLDRAFFPLEIVATFESTQYSENVLRQMIAKGAAHEIVVTTPEASKFACLVSALDTGVAVSSLTTFIERNFWRTPVNFLSPAWFIDVDFKQHHPFFEPTKRMMDITVAVIAGLLTLPVVGMAAILIKLESRGPVFYSQVRVGLRQRHFRIWKLRTMRTDSEADGPRWAAISDPRVTRVGRILRKTRIDEVPQFWNILIGEMAFVGPRPERPEFVTKLATVIPFYQQRHLLKPGLTGWAQICYPYGASEKEAAEKLSYDLFYLKNASLLLDLQIIMQTLGAMAKGAR
jgi:exopolysaccharide biosynthesis polyprenyl glycosylphosphotransferase